MQQHAGGQRQKGSLQDAGLRQRRKAGMPSATYFLLVQKVCKNTLKEENPFDWVFSLKDLSFLNDQRGGGPFGNPEL
jgi:hypothetical protein